MLAAAVYARQQLRAADVVEGPAVVEEAGATTIVEPGDRVTVNQFGHLVMAVRL